jgi:hypothetical protein
MSTNPGEVLLVRHQQLNADWAAVRLKLVEVAGSAALAALLTDLNSGKAALGSLFGVANAFSFGPGTPDGLAYKLLTTGLTTATVEVANDALPRQLPKGDAHRLSRDAELRLEQDVVLTQGFFEVPDSLPVVQTVRDRFLEFIAGALGGEAEAEKWRLPFRTALIRALDAEWRRDQQAYGELVRDLDTSFATAWREMRAWDQYDREKILAGEWRAPIFDEKFGLDQVYVPLRAG